MAITRANFDGIGPADLQELVDAGATESQVLEFKRDSYGNSDADKRELLKDVSGLANTHGGHLLIGVDAPQAVATSVPGFVVPNIDAEVLRLDSIIRTGIEPPIVGLRIKWVPLGNGNHCILVRVPQSWNLPHRVSFQQSSKFFIRHSASVDQASMDELRSLFGLAVEAVERIRAFHNQRVSAIVGGGGLRPLVGPGRMIAHLVPLASFASRIEIDLQRVSEMQHRFGPIGAAGGHSPRFNFDGFINERAGERNFGYTQVFRNGVVEACKGSLIFNGRYGSSIVAQKFEKEFFDGLNAYLPALRDLGVAPPVLVMISIQEVAGTHYQIRPDAMYFDDDVPRLDRDLLALPECVIETYGTDNDHRRAMLPAFNALWNAMRRPRDEFVTDDGIWHA